MSQLKYTFILFLILLPITAAQSAEGEGDTIMLWAEIVIFILLMIAIIQNIGVILKFGSSTLGGAFIYILTGTIFMLLIRVMIVLYDIQFFNVSDSTILWEWHFLFYAGMIAYLLALNKLKKSVTTLKSAVLSKNDLIALAALAMLAIIIFVSVNSFNNWTSPWLEHSHINTFGLHHFIAFAFSGFWAVQLFWAKANMGKIIKILVPPLLFFLFLISLIHFWELLAESWKIIELSEYVIESVEQVFWIIGLLALNYGFFKFKREIPGTNQKMKSVS